MRDIRWAIVGTGDVSHSIAPDFALADGARLVAVCSRSMRRAELFAKAHRIPAAFDDLDRLLEDPGVDAVYIATPHGTHHRLALRALDGGKHVMVEKPMALDSAQVNEILQRAKLRGLLAMEAMWMRFNPTIVEVARVVDEGAIGDVRSVRATFGFPFPREEGSRWSAALGGSTLLDQGIYPVTLARMLLGDSSSITASAVIQDGVDVALHATLEYPGDRFAQIAVSVLEYVDLSAAVNGTDGWITIDAPFWASGGFQVHSAAERVMGSIRHDVARRGNGFVPMIEAAGAGIREGRLDVDRHPGEEALRVFGELDAIRNAMSVDRADPALQPADELVHR